MSETTTLLDAVEATPTTPAKKKTWLDELIERLQQVITKLLIKLGIKLTW